MYDQNQFADCGLDAQILKNSIGRKFGYEFQDNDPITAMNGLLSDTGFPGRWRQVTNDELQLTRQYQDLLEQDALQLGQLQDLNRHLVEVTFPLITPKNLRDTFGARLACLGADEKISVLIADDGTAGNTRVVEDWKKHLNTYHELKVEIATTLDQAVRALNQVQVMYDVVIIDLWFPQPGDGLEVIEEFENIRGGREATSHLIVFTAQKDDVALRTGWELLKAERIDDFILKSDAVHYQILIAIQHYLIGREKKAAHRAFMAHDLIGDSEGMRKVKDQIERVAGTDCSVLLNGETGTGKDVVASLIHRCSPRRNQPFLQINCGGLQDTLLRAELFGTVPGAFNGAVDRGGLIAAANGGTLFLNEIQTMSTECQNALLDFLQYRTYRRLGEDTGRRADVRIITATNADLGAAIQNGSFRLDLYHRIRIFLISLPPVRERGQEDIGRLVNHLLAQLKKRHNKPGIVLADEAFGVLTGYAWPGNVHEIMGILEQAVVSVQNGTISAEYIRQCLGGHAILGDANPPQPAASQPLPPPVQGAPPADKDALERRIERATSVDHKNNKAIRTGTVHTKLVTRLCGYFNEHGAILPNNVKEILEEMCGQDGFNPGPTYIPKMAGAVFKTLIDGGVIDNNGNLME